MSAQDWRVIGECATNLADAIDGNDPIMGMLASRGLLVNIAALPQELRDEIADACVNADRLLQDFGPDDEPVPA